MSRRWVCAVEVLDSVVRREVRVEVRVVRWVVWLVDGLVVGGLDGGWKRWWRSGRLRWRGSGFDVGMSEWPCRGGKARLGQSPLLNCRRHRHRLFCRAVDPVHDVSRRCWRTWWGCG